MKPRVREEVLTKVLEDTDSTELKDLVVFNDDVNTFDHVINTLVRVCKHSPHQAEQCTLIIHHNGKCAVKKGAFEELKPMRQGICDAGISAEIL
jgi:ATP-dependent Clp protease adaptor protein ClpS